MNIKNPTQKNRKYTKYINYSHNEISLHIYKRGKRRTKKPLATPRASEEAEQLDLRLTAVPEDSLAKLNILPI